MFFFYDVVVSWGDTVLEWIGEREVSCGWESGFEDLGDVQDEWVGGGLNSVL